MSQPFSPVAQASVAAQHYPPFIVRIIQEHRLGVPQGVRRDQQNWFVLPVGIGIILVVGLCNLANVALYAGTPGSLSSGTPVTRSALDILAQGWLLDAIFLFLALVCILTGINSMRHVAYECSEGFVEMTGKRASQIIHWNDVQRTWTDVVRIYAGKGQRRRVVRYFLLGKQGETVRTEYQQIWRRATYEVAQREFSHVSVQMRADFNAGRPVVFERGIFVDQQGVHIPGGAIFNQNGWLLPLQAITKASAQTSLVFELHPAANLPTVHTLAPENAGLLLLFLQMMSNGNIRIEHASWPLF